MSTSNRAGSFADVPDSQDRGSFLERWVPVFLAAFALGLGAFCVYGGIFSYPFILDDLSAITANGTIAHASTAFFPPSQSPVSGRPLLNASYALNWALGGDDVRGYHEFNLLVHVLCALTVFGIVRHTLAKPALRGRFADDRLSLAFLAAALWTVHPLNTEAVTYISERAESLMGLFYLATVYFFARADESRKPAVWYALSVVACMIGALTKEVIATAPVIVLLYDRTFCAGSLREAWRRRRPYYASLAASWLLLAFLVSHTGERGVGFGSGVGAWAYLLTSCRSLVLYAKLAFWPHSLVFDYGMAILRRPSEVVRFAPILLALLAFTFVALRKWPAVGFACAWFFVILAPTTSIVPLAYQPMAEHRAYLSLVAASCLTVLMLYHLLGRACLVPLVALVIFLGLESKRRNEDYRSDLSIWSDTVAKQPDNPRAHANLGAALARIPGREREAVSEDEKALRIKPDYAEAHNNLGLLMASALGRFPEAVAEFEAAIHDEPDYLEAHDNLGMALASEPGRMPQAISEFETALRINPGYAKAHNDLGTAFGNTPGRLPEAIGQFEQAVRLRPNYTEAKANLDTAQRLLAVSGKAQ